MQIHKRRRIQFDEFIIIDTSYRRNNPGLTTRRAKSDGRKIKKIVKPSAEKEKKNEDYTYAKRKNRAHCSQDVTHVHS